MAGVNHAWVDSFRGQAAADLAAAHALSHDVLTIQRASVVAMLLQMAFEKFAKAVLVHSGSAPRSVQSHAVMNPFVVVLRRMLQEPLRDAFLKAEPALRLLESLQPAVANPRTLRTSRGYEVEQLEYPWEDSGGSVRFPARDLSIAVQWSQGNGDSLHDVLAFAKLLDADFDQLFQ